MSTRRRFVRQVLSGLMVLGTGILRAPAALAEGLSRIKGKIVARGADNYEITRASMTWYVFKPNRYPDMIIRAESDQDVVEAINYAREKNLKLATRATGHNPARGSLRQGGILLDTSMLREVSVDAQAGTAWIEPGIRSEEFVELTHDLGWSFPAAHTGIVGMGGYVLGGGLGWNMPHWDIACRSIIGAEIAMADGSIRSVSAEENPDLLWAIRGVGPGFFGCVLRYQLKLFPVPRAIVKSKYIVPVDKMAQLMPVLREIADSKESSLEILAVVGRFVPAEEFPENRPLVCAISAVAFGADRADAIRLLKPVAESPLAEMSTIKQENADQAWGPLYAGQDTDHSSPNRTAIHNIWTNDAGEALMKLTDRLQSEPPRSPRSFLLTAWGIKPSRDDDDSAWTYAGDDYVSWYLMAEQASDVEANFAWMDESVELVRPETRGNYLNEMNPERYPDDLKASFTPEKWSRLVSLRQKYDPGGVFHSYLGWS